MTNKACKHQRCRISYLVTVLAVALIAWGCGLSNQGTDSNGQGREIYYRNSVIALMYHDLGEPEGAATISPERFTAQLDMLEVEGFTVISLPRLAAFLNGRQQVPANAVVLTFDDGYRSAFKIAYPLLKERGWTAGFFVIVSQLGNPGDDGTIPKLTWEQMRRMQSDGFNFYSHTYDSHRYVRVNAEGATKPALAGTALRSEFDLTAPPIRETEEQYQERVRQDFSLARELLQRKLGNAGQFMSAPYGWAGDSALAVAQELGFRYNFTVKPGLITRQTSPVKLWRVNAGSPELDAQQLKAAILTAVNQQPGD